MRDDRQPRQFRCDGAEGLDQAVSLEALCVIPCDLGACDVAPLSCGALPAAALTECRMVGGLSACFPLTCDSVVDCPSGAATCDAGFCV